MSGHTPGPWIIAPPGGPQGPFYGLVNGAGNVVATQIVGEANARLIAKSPQLLTTLKDVIAHLRSFTLDPGEGEDDAPALTAAEALIAEAEGSTQ